MIQPGDILLWRVDKDAPLLDRLIGWGETQLKEKTPQNRQYYHVATVSEDVGKMYSSQPPMIDLYPVPNPLPPYIEVYRLKGGVTAEGLKRVFEYAESRRGRWYDFVGVLTAGFVELGGLEFCSQLTEDAWFQYPVSLSPDVRFTSPDDIAGSPLLEKVLSTK